MSGASPHGSPAHGARIVVGYDGSYAAAAAIERAIDRASPDGRVIVVHAWQPPAVLRGSELYPVVATAFCSAAEAVLERVAAEHPRLADVSWERRLLEAPPAKAIADVAKAERADEVVVGTRGAGRMHALLGGTALGILHRAECPVTFIPGRMSETSQESPSGATRRGGATA